MQTVEAAVPEVSVGVGDGLELGVVSSYGELVANAEISTLPDFQSWPIKITIGEAKVSSSFSSVIPVALPKALAWAKFPDLYKISEAESRLLEFPTLSTL